jgi:hypothetical protein
MRGEESELVTFGSPVQGITLRRTEVRNVIHRGEKIVRDAVAQGMLDWLPDPNSKRYAMFVAFAGVGQPITDRQCRDLAGVVYGILQGRSSDNWESFKFEGRALSIRWAAASTINSNPNHGFVLQQGDSYVCPMW